MVTVLFLSILALRNCFSCAFKQRRISLFFFIDLLSTLNYVRPVHTSHTCNKQDFPLSALLFSHLFVKLLRKSLFPDFSFLRLLRESSFLDFSVS